MSRGLTTALKNELATYVLRPVHLITFGFSTPANLTGSSTTYTPTAFVQNISSFTEEVGISKSSLRIGLSGVNQAYISIVLSENVINDTFKIFRGFLDDNNALIADPFLLYDGHIDKFEITESEKETDIIFTIVSHWADFNKISGRKTNPTSQQRFFSTDKGMEFSSQTVQDIKWGRE